MNMIDIKTNEAAIFSLYLNTRLMYGDKRYIEIIFLTVYPTQEPGIECRVGCLILDHEIVDTGSQPSVVIFKLLQFFLLIS